MAEAMRDRQEQKRGERQQECTTVTVSGIFPKGKEPMQEGLAPLQYKKIVLADNMEPEVIERLKVLGPVEFKQKGYKPEEKAELIAALADAEVLVVRSATKVTRELLEHAPKLKMVLRGGVGLDNVDKEACKEKEIKVFNTPKASRQAVTELVFGCAFALLRKIPELDAKMKKGEWDKAIGTELAGKTIGIVGCGGIGSTFAAAAHAFGANVIAYDAKSPKEQNGIPFVKDIEELYAQADIITYHVPLNDGTKGMINKDTIAKMKDGVIIINTARGGIIVEADLHEALVSGKVAGAALDVFPKEPYTGNLAGLPNTVCTPHIGANTKEAQMRIGNELFEIMEQQLRN